MYKIHFLLNKIKIWENNNSLISISFKLMITNYNKIFNYKNKIYKSFKIKSIIIIKRIFLHFNNNTNNNINKYKIFKSINQEFQKFKNNKTIV